MSLGGLLACPARFERATYALEAGKMNRNNSLNNGFKVLKSGAAYTPRVKVSGGNDRISDGVDRRSVVKFVG